MPDAPIRGDVVVYELDGLTRVARVVGVAGDTVATDDEGGVTIDGDPIDEPYLADGTTTRLRGPVEVPAGDVFLLGDNRDNAQDSRYFGPLPTEQVRALVVLRWWPLPPGSLNR